MKRKSSIWLMAALAGVLCLSITSCKDDDDNDGIDKASTVSIDQSFVTHGIEAELQSAVVEVPVNCNGFWTAVIENGTDWVMIKDWKVSYEGNQTLTFLFDENNTGADRSTTLSLGNNYGELTNITIRQTATIDGQAPKNSSGLAFAGQGVGCGIDYDYALNAKLKKNGGTFQPTKVKKNNNIFNIEQIEKLKNEGALQASAYTETYIPFTDLQVQMIDSSMLKTKNVDFNLKMGVSFGAIEFSARGHFKSTKKQTEDAVDYIISRNAPMYNVILSTAELRTYASNPQNNQVDQNTDEALINQINQLIARYKRINELRRLTNLDKDGLTPDQAKIISGMLEQTPMTWTWGGIFSTNFAQRYNELYQAIVANKLAGKPIDTEAADNTLNMIDNDYGPFFISGGDFGGNITVHCKALDRMLDGSGKFDGSISGKMQGLFQVSGAFDYSEQGVETLHNCNMSLYIYGGNADDTASELMALTTGQKISDRDKWLNVLKNWVGSMYTASDKKPLQSAAAPLSFVIEPIWTVFSYPEVQKYAQEYFIKKYQSRGIKGYLGIGLGTIKPNADQTLNTESDFWGDKTENSQIPLISNPSN